MNKVRKSFIFGMLFCLLCAYEDKPSMRFQNHVKRATDSQCNLVLRQYDNGSVYQDIVSPSDLPIGNRIDSSNLLDGFMSSGRTYRTNEIDEIKRQIIEVAEKADLGSVSSAIPSDFDTNNPINIVTTPEVFMETIENSKLPKLDQKMQWLSDVYQSYLQNENPIEHEIGSRQTNYDVKTLNVFVAGIGGRASDWANKGAEGELAVTYQCLPYKVAQHYSSRIFVGGCDLNGINPSVSLVDPSSYGKTSYLLQPDSIKASTNSFLDGSVILYDDVHENIDNMDGKDGSIGAYTAFKNFMNELVSCFPNAVFNLYGHSRGGLLNLRYSSEYASKVNRIFSMGTPYYSPIVAGIEDYLYKKVNTDGYFSNLANWYDLTIHLAAYEDLANEDTLKNIREHWNECGSQAKLHTFGYGVSTHFSVFVMVGIFLIRIDFEVDVGWDSLVGTENACGFPNQKVVCKGLFSHDLITYASSDNTYPLNPEEYTKTYFSLSYIFDVMINQKTWLLSEPGKWVVPHNLETMDSGTHRSIMEDLANDQ